MRVDLFDFHLPETAIALRPAVPRDGARLLVVTPSPRHGGSPALLDRHVRDLPQQLRAGDCLVFNNTRVIPAALDGVRLRIGGTGLTAKVAFTLIKRIDAATWRAFARPAKRLVPGDIVQFGKTLTATVTAKGAAGEADLAFDLSGAVLDAAIATVGMMPLPPYIALKRAPEASDTTDYQTMFAVHDGAVAAPTAALHFTPDLLAALSVRGVTHETVTLHVGAGTFLPMKVDDTDDHVMHSEWGEITAETAASLNAVRARGGRIIPVGTTSLRLLESAASPDGRLHPFSGDTAIFITPGTQFKCADGLMTNFHLPKSTLLMLVSAFSGTATIQRVYAHAIAADYRFYSYGDACLLWPARR